MLRLAATRGHGSIIWATLLAATASPAREGHGVAPVEIHVGAGAEQRRAQRQDRSQYPQGLSVRDMALSLGNVEDVADRRRRAVRAALDAASIGTVISRWPSRKNSGSFAGCGGVERRAQHVAGPRRAHQARRHDDDEVGFLLLVDGAARTARRAPARRRARAAASGRSWLMLCSRPAIAKLWPSRSSTVVLARRTISAGMVMPPTRIDVGRDRSGSPPARSSG